jgi:hypothetical protein
MTVRTPIGKKYQSDNLTIELIEFNLVTILVGVDTVVDETPILAWITMKIGWYRVLEGVPPHVVRASNVVIRPDLDI